MWRAESFWSRSHEQRVPKAEFMWQQSSRTSPWSVWPSLWRFTQSDSHLEPRYLLSLHTRLIMYSSSYALVSLCTGLPTHLSPYALVLLLRPCTSRKNIPLKYLFEIVHLSRYHPQLSQYATRKLSCQLDAIDDPPLCGSQSPHQSTRLTGWMTSGYLQYVITSMTKTHF